MLSWLELDLRADRKDLEDLTRTNKEEHAKDTIDKRKENVPKIVNGTDIADSGPKCFSSGRAWQGMIYFEFGQILRVWAGKSQMVLRVNLFICTTKMSSYCCMQDNAL